MMHYMLPFQGEDAEDDENLCLQPQDIVRFQSFQFCLLRVSVSHIGNEIHLLLMI